VAQEIYFRGLDPSLNQRLVYEMSDLLLCAGLIHDIGNPPFGHYGETTIRDWFVRRLPQLTYFDKSLDKLLLPQMKEDLFAFDGNAQALRLLTKLHFLKDEYGMNLTIPLLNTIIKYPVSSLDVDKDHKNVQYHKMGYFLAEKDVFDAIVDITGATDCRHPLTFLLEAADDIAYRTADLEDAYKKGRFTYGQFRETLWNTPRLAAANSIQRDNYYIYCDVLDQKLEEGYARKVNKPELFALQNWVIFVQGLMLQTAATSFCDHYDAIMNGRYEKELLTGTQVDVLLQTLGDIAVDYVFTSKQIISLEIAANNILGGLLDMFIPACIEWDTDHPQSSLEPRLMAIISDNYRSNYYRRSEGKDEIEKLYLRLLLVTDYICGMTDSFAKQMYRNMNGL
ncbi:MAG TPA: dNTP triphosphohydrolase, partial [Clostridiaceae bacterium]|nr:dNTP triphosphohydrolase [Clostridiaceae bacterium]